MAFAQTEQFIIWLREPVSETLALVPATNQRPWRLLRGDELLCDIPLPPMIDAGSLFAAIEAATAARGWQVRACGACAYWHVLDSASAGGAGSCVWSYPDAPRDASAQQGILAAPCTHFAAAATDAVPPPATAASPAESTSGTARTWWQRLWPHRSGQSTRGSDQGTANVVERSGRRPGTIPCLACPGRMANFGAQKCRTHEGDERTFSIWRCRQCLGYYLNDWTDKWVRTDALEVVDIYYRLAPHEALTCLDMIEQAGLKQITPADLQRWTEAFLAGHDATRKEVRRAR